MKVSVVLPTVDGREEHLERALGAFKADADADSYEVEIIVYHNRPCVGVAWQEGAEIFTGDYLLFTADDLEPHRGWAKAGVSVADEGHIPMDTLYNNDGSLDQLGQLTLGCSRIPFCSREQWEKIGPMVPLHYFTDNWFSYRAKQAGYEIRNVEGFTFTHHWAMPKRGAGMSQQARMAYDQGMFNQYVKEGYGG